MSDHIYAQSEIFAVVRQLLKKYHAESAILFGSYARQEANVASDIDLIVVGGSKFDPTDIFCIAEELHRTMGKAVFTNCERSILVPLSTIRSWRKESGSHEIQ